MKNSGIEWIGEIPDSWKVVETKFLFDIFSGATPDTSVPENWDGGINWITPADFKSDDYYVSTGKKSITIKGLNSCSATIVPEDSLIFSKRAPIGAVVIAKNELCTNQGCLSCVNKGQSVTKYYYYVMRAAEKIYELYGAGTTFKEIAALKFANFVLPCPNVNEQETIQLCLSNKMEKVDKLIEVQQAQIEKLKEYKQSVITEAVTKGLNPTAPMKDSGVEWIGKIPESWKVMRLKDAIESHFGGCWGEEASEDDGILCIRIADFDFDRQTIKSSASTKRQYSIAQLEKGVLQDGDLILEKSGGGEKTSVGRVVVFEQKMFPCKAMFANFSECLRLKRNLHNEKYCAYLLKALYYTKEMSCFYHQTTGIQNLDIAEYLSMNLCFPSRNEQDFIVACLDKKLVEIDKLIALKQSKIEKLQEYKKSLIYEYVTGKKEVM